MSTSGMWIFINQNVCDPAPDLSRCHWPISQVFSPNKAILPSRLQLVSAIRAKGITTLRLTRDLAAYNTFDVPINATGPANFVWAYGPVTPG